MAQYENMTINHSPFLESAQSEQLFAGIVQRFTYAPHVDQALMFVVEQVCAVLRVDVCSIFLCDDVRGEYVLRAAVGLPVEQIGHARLSYGEGLVGLVAEREEPINVDSAPSHPHFLAHAAVPEAYHGFLGVPIIEQGELLAILIVQRHEARFFSEAEEAWCITLAVQLAPEMARLKARGLLEKEHHKKPGGIFNGISGAPGVAIGVAVVVYPPADLEAVPEKRVTDIGVEIQAFEVALAAAREEIDAIQVRAKTTLSVAENAIFDVYLRILDSRTLINEVIDRIKEGQWAQGALKYVIQQHVLQFEALDDPYLRERGADFRDLGRRILGQLQSNQRQFLVFPKNTILVSDEVTATTLMEVPQDCLKGVISGSGSSNSHVAILARALGLPTVMGVTGMSLDVLANKECIVDGYHGQIYITPPASVKKEFRQLVSDEQKFDEQLAAFRDLSAVTQDNHTVALYINTGLAVESGLLLNVGAEGVGLYRTELPFMMRDRFPSEEEQRVMYRQLLSTFAPRPVVMRALDIGGDKTLPYFSVKEDNPFLGWRGIRVMLAHPEIFLQQIRAMLQASQGLNNLSIMLPMISSVNEVEASLRFINQAFSEVISEGFVVEKPPIGLMIEVPAAIYQAYELAKRVDFLSVGSNDLIQYLLAVDRNNPRVASLYNGFHPAVLRALSEVVKAGHRAGKPVGMCGELAGDSLASVILLGLGFDSLSMNARSLARVKWVIRNFTLHNAKNIVTEVLKMDDAQEVRLHLEVVLEELGLGGLIRAGL